MQRASIPTIIGSNPIKGAMSDLIPPKEKNGPEYMKEVGSKAKCEEVKEYKWDDYDAYGYWHKLCNKKAAYKYIAGGAVNFLCKKCYPKIRKKHPKMEIRKIDETIYAPDGSRY